MQNIQWHYVVDGKLPNAADAPHIIFRTISVFAAMRAGNGHTWVYEAEYDPGRRIFLLPNMDTEVTLSYDRPDPATGFILYAWAYREIPQPPAVRHPFERWSE